MCARPSGCSTSACREPSSRIRRRRPESSGPRSRRPDVLPAGVMLALAALLATSPAAAQVPDHDAAVSAAEAALADAIAARNADALGRLIADEFTTADVPPLDRPAWIESLLPLCGGGRIAAGDRQIVVRGDSA